MPLVGTDRKLVGNLRMEAIEENKSSLAISRDKYRVEHQK